MMNFRKEIRIPKLQAQEIYTAQKEFDYFPCPKQCAQLMYNVCKRTKLNVLDATAGLGESSRYFISDEDRKVSKLILNDINEQMSKLCKRSYRDYTQVSVTTRDFLESEPMTEIDVILVNPPYTKGGDRLHYLRFIDKALQYKPSYKILASLPIRYMIDEKTEDLLYPISTKEPGSRVCIHPPDHVLKEKYADYKNMIERIKSQSEITLLHVFSPYQFKKINNTGQQTNVATQIGLYEIRPTTEKNNKTGLFF